ncbi:MAG: ion transporter [Solirubrobacterales bacterium]
MGPLSKTCRRIADNARFQGFIMLVIVANATTLGLATYAGIEDEVGSLLNTLDDVFIGIFVLELAIRILAYGSRPQDFFKDGWNVFDFVVIGAAFAPGLRENATLLRLARLLRVLRLVTILPDLRGIVRAMVRSLPPIGSLVVLMLMLMFVYGMVGWILFHTEDPEQWANIGQAMLTLFVMLTLENWPNYLEAGQAIHPASWIYFVSYILIASFLVINILLAIIINSMEEVRENEQERKRERTRERRAEDIEAGGVQAEAALAAETADAIAQRVKILREALDDLERDLGGSPSRRAAGRVTTKARLKP